MVRKIRIGGVDIAYSYIQQDCWKQDTEPPHILHISLSQIHTYLRTEACAATQLQYGLALEMSGRKLGLEETMHGHGGVPLL